MVEHERTFLHAKGRLNVSIAKGNENVTIWRNLRFSLLHLFLKKTKKILFESEAQSILTWSFCKICGCITPSMPLSEGFNFINWTLTIYNVSIETYNYSLGKYLELSFYCFDAPCRAKACNHSIFRDHVRYFFFNNMVKSPLFSTKQMLMMNLLDFRLQNLNMKIFKILMRSFFQP